MEIEQQMLSSEHSLRSKGYARQACFFGNYIHSITGPNGNQIAIPKPLMRVIKASKESQLLLVWWNNEQFIRAYTYESLTRKIPNIHAKIRSELIAEGQNEAKAEELADKAIAELSSKAMQVEPDKQGRIVLPKQWMEKLGMRGSVKIEGRYSYISIGRVETEEKAEESAATVPAENEELNAKVTAQLNKW